jgi:glycosyltransferase involved in cell wall biosynthesis
MNKKTSVSVIIPAFNAEKTISRTLKSLLHQRLNGGLEVIIIDDGSTDATCKIVKEFSNQYPLNINLISTPNCGEGAARNNGFLFINGKYLLFLDADDTLASKALPKLQETAEHFNADLVFSSYQKVFSDTSIKNYICPLRTYNREQLQRDFFKRQITLGIGNTLISSKIVLKSGMLFGNYRAGTDNHFFRELLKYVERGVSIPEVLFHYNVNNESIMHSSYSENRIDSIISVIDSKLSYSDKSYTSVNRFLDVFLVNEIKGNALAFLTSQKNPYSKKAWKFVELEILKYMPKSTSSDIYFGQRRFFWLFSLLIFSKLPRISLYIYITFKKIRG